ncbi:uncharacterized protein EV154DRAFT_556885 [Mucor mucedo]|uniref:uncharacterized protein n=1 Tax=Mucor mucedo TaxID=29922 RepID=UPI00221F030D|nr:uncharacterized protein EV154DRAFT_556885 [Mucor mucedo]KAI7868215.1 hypothetical protein EV154DRAFT_556885 [Mucor mucedo]
MRLYIYNKSLSIGGINLSRCIYKSGSSCYIRMIDIPFTLLWLFLFLRVNNFTNSEKKSLPPLETSNIQLLRNLRLAVTVLENKVNTFIMENKILELRYKSLSDDYLNLRRENLRLNESLLHSLRYQGVSQNSLIGQVPKQAPTRTTSTVKTSTSRPPEVNKNQTRSLTETEILRQNMLDVMYPLRHPLPSILRSSRDDRANPDRTQSIRRVHFDQSGNLSQQDNSEQESRKRPNDAQIQQDDSKKKCQRNK